MSKAAYHPIVEIGNILQTESRLGEWDITEPLKNLVRRQAHREGFRVFKNCAANRSRAVAQWEFQVNGNLLYRVVTLYESGRRTENLSR